MNICIMHIQDYMYKFLFNCNVYIHTYIYTHLCTLRNIERPNLGLVILVLGNTQCIKLESLQKGTPLVQDQIEPHQSWSNG